MQKRFMLVETDCADPAREGEFNEWYNQIHLPDVLETPGVVRAERYEKIDPSEGQGKYLAAYEAEADDLQAVLKASDENMKKKAAEGRMSDLLKVTAVSTFGQIYSASE